VGEEKTVMRASTHAEISLIVFEPAVFPVHFLFSLAHDGFIDDGDVVGTPRRGYGQVPETALSGLVKEEGLLV